MGVYLAYIPIQGNEHGAKGTSTTPNFELEGVRFGDMSRLNWMGVYLTYIPIQDNEHGAKDSLLSLEITRLCAYEQMP